MMRIILIILFAYYTEKVHRYVFDNVFVQNGRPFTMKEKAWIFLLKVMCLIHPIFRVTLKKYQYIFRRAYIQKRLSWKYVSLHHFLRKNNYNRYTVGF